MICYSLFIRYDMTFFGPQTFLCSQNVIIKRCGRNYFKGCAFERIIERIKNRQNFLLTKDSKNENEVNK